MAELLQTPVVMTGQAWADYGLIDSGDGRKLERYGPHSFIRFVATSAGALGFGR
jgi:23S rRNA (cytosine1962-C5)-methyltransferase